MDPTPTAREQFRGDSQEASGVPAAPPPPLQARPPRSPRRPPGSAHTSINRRHRSGLRSRHAAAASRRRRFSSASCSFRRSLSRLLAAASPGTLRRLGRPAGPAAGGEPAGPAAPRSRGSGSLSGSDSETAQAAARRAAHPGPSRSLPPIAEPPATGRR